MLEGLQWQYGVSPRCTANVEDWAPWMGLPALQQSCKGVCKTSHNA